MKDPYATHRLPAYGAAFCALLLGSVPLPHWAALMRPDLLLMVVMWFALMSPRSTGLAFAFCWGLLADAFTGILLGERALGFVVVAYIVHATYQRMRMFPMLHQSLVVLALLWLYQFLTFWIDGVSGHPVNEWTRLLPGLSGAVLWPLVSQFFTRIIERR